MRCCVSMIFSYKDDAGTCKVLRQFWKRSIKCCSKAVKRFVPVQFFIIRARCHLSAHKIRCHSKAPKRVCAGTIFYYKGDTVCQCARKMPQQGRLPAVSCHSSQALLRAYRELLYLFNVLPCVKQGSCPCSETRFIAFS